MHRLTIRPAHTFAVFPTLLTLCNAACGFGSITISAKASTLAQDVGLMFLAGLFIFAAMVFDVLDGQVARWTKQISDFGRELDSLCDVVSFGLAPALIVLKCSYHYHPRFLWLIAALYLICVVLRLARYNVQSKSEDRHMSFNGLPSPAAAGTVASVAIAMPGLTALAEYGATEQRQAIGEALTAASSVCLPLIMLTVAVLMVSRIRYPHFNQWFQGRRNFHRLAQLVIAILAIAAVHELAVPIIFFYFVLAPLLRATWVEVFARRFGSSSPLKEYRSVK